MYTGSAQLSAGYLTLRFEVTRPARGRRAPETEEVRVEIMTSLIRMWDEPPGGELYQFDCDPSEPGDWVSDPLIKMPHLDYVHRQLAEIYAANRKSLVGKHLEPAVNAMERAIAARDGSSVYFAEADGRIKIGWSRKVSTRLAQLQTGSATPIRLLGAIPGGRAVERRLHDQFAHLRISGEWFRSDQELIDHITALVAIPGCAPAS